MWMVGLRRSENQVRDINVFFSALRRALVDLPNVSVEAVQPSGSVRQAIDL